MTNDFNHSVLKLAYRFVNGTNRHIFLTGKAGTGKTTFLKNIVNQTHKKVLVAAPTGIAAINAGGVTLHSLFQLPFGVFLPENPPLDGPYLHAQVNTPHSVSKSLRLNNNKRKLIREMELLIIDEVSMLRADTLDAIDQVLRLVRREKSRPFGGVQILFIGDLLQLPPVIKKEERQYLQKYYSDGYFFESRGLHDDPPVYIELEHIFRQSDPAFIQVLNHIRDNTLDRQDMDLLNRCYQPGFQPARDEPYIFLTTHNAKADQINRDALKKLPGKSFHFRARIEGEFGEHLYPIDDTLELKKGAQVMFIKNDYSGEQRYFNGKIGTISELSKEEIEVSFSDGSASTSVELYTWENKYYTLDQEKNEIQEQIKGTFTQFPIKLAWAITVHKSQGLTFEKAIIDVSRAFAPGQIYVALSRLVSLQGLVLNAPIPTHMLEPDPALVKFTTGKPSPRELEETFHKEWPRYLLDDLLQGFDLTPLDEAIQDHLASYQKKGKKSTKQQYRPWAVQLEGEFSEIKDVANRFQVQLKKLGQSTAPDWLAHLQEKVHAAGSYFVPRLNQLARKIMGQINHLDKEVNVKKYIRELKDLEYSVRSRRQAIEKAVALTDAVAGKKELSRVSVRPEGNGQAQSRGQSSSPSLPTSSSKASSKNGSSSKASKAPTASKTIPPSSASRSPSPGPKDSSITGSSFGTSGGQQDQGKHPPKQKKPGTREISYQMFQQGKNTEQIAFERNLAVSTVEGHLSHWVSQGKIDVMHFIGEEKLAQIIQVARHIGSTKLTDIKARLGEEFTYSDLRFAMAKYHFDHNEH